jgi:hypothetical protein
MKVRIAIGGLLLVATLTTGSTAAASTPSVFLGAATTTDRFQSRLTFTYAAPVTITDASTQVSVQRIGGLSTIPSIVSGSGTSTIEVLIPGTLAAGRSYAAKVQPDGDSTVDQVTWTTRSTPTHPTLHVKIVTALESDVSTEIAHRLDRLNLLAVPRPADLVDISTATGRALTSTDLKGYQAAFVVTDQDVLASSTDASVLSNFATNKHGVVLAGQTHWTDGGLWSAQSAIGSPTGAWATNWSPLDYTDPPALEGGSLRKGSIQTHFLTANFTALTINAPGSGAQTTHQGWNEQILARLAPTTAYGYGQSLLAVHTEIPAQPGRVVDLGFNPWSTDVASGGGGFDASQAQAEPLIGRSLLWSMNRIPPRNTHFTSKPASPSRFATVFFNMAAGDVDTEGGAMLRYQYKVNKGRWKWASGGNAFALYHLKPGAWYMVRARAVDSGGNKDPVPAHYLFRLSTSAYG